MLNLPEISGDYQFPLFALFDLSVAFDRQADHVRRTLRQSWSRFVRMGDDEVKKNVFCEVCPLTLYPDEAFIKSEKRTQYIAYEYHIPFSGDAELWNMYPVTPQYSVLGETFRGNLILQVCAQNERIARAAFQSELETIGGILAQQAARIAVFHAAVPTLIQAEVAKLRNAPIGSHGGRVH